MTGDVSSSSTTATPPPLPTRARRRLRPGQIVAITLCALVFAPWLVFGWQVLFPAHLDLRVLGVRYVSAAEYGKIRGRSEAHVFVRVATKEDLRRWRDAGVVWGAVRAAGKHMVAGSLVWTDAGTQFRDGGGSGAWYEIGVDAHDLAARVRAGDPLEVRIAVSSKPHALASSDWISLAPWRDELLRLLPPK